MIARYYSIEVKQKGGKVESIFWEFSQGEKAVIDFNGSYFIRTRRTDLDEKTIWSIYTMLTRVEESFRCLKSELNLRPVWHQQSRESLIYNSTGISFIKHYTEPIKRKANTYALANNTQAVNHTGQSNNIDNKKDRERVLIRNTSLADNFQQSIYLALGLSSKPLRSIRTG